MSNQPETGSHPSGDRWAKLPGIAKLGRGTTDEEAIADLLRKIETGKADQ